ncbi:MAG: ferritin [candidate division Zixibacteria bacterium]|jgi:ferritin|nr:ferritin [candidate division Zixibacteria bacterium]
MISEKIVKALNDQIAAEMYSHYLYLAMAAYFHDENLPGFGSWMKIQAAEEMSHAMKIYDHIIERGGRVALQKIDAPPAKWDSPLAAFENAYKHECEISSKINNIVDLAIAEKDHATNVFLHWFVDEQVEEEANALEIVNHMKLLGESKGGLLMLDRNLAKRE